MGARPTVVRYRQVRSAEELAHLVQRLNEPLDLRMRVVERERRAAGGRHAVVLQQRVGAVLAGADGHAFQVQQGGQVVCMRAFDQEGDGRRLGVVPKMRRPSILFSSSVKCARSSPTRASTCSRPSDSKWSTATPKPRKPAMLGVPASWDVVNVAFGAESARSNFSEGNVAAGLVDSIGVIIGLTATAVAIIPGGAGTAIKAMRATDKAIEAARSGRNANKLRADTDTDPDPDAAGAHSTFMRGEGENISNTATYESNSN